MAAGLMLAVGILLVLQRLSVKIERRERALVQLENALRERQELVSELMLLCAGYLVTEKQLMEELALSRLHAMQARTVLAKVKTETDLCWSLARLMTTVAGHHDLQGHPRFSETVEDMGAAEDRAALAMTDYNNAVLSLEVAMTQQVSRLLAGLLQLRPGHPFDLDPRVARESMMSQILSVPRSAEGTESRLPWESLFAVGRRQNARLQ